MKAEVLTGVEPQSVSRVRISTLFLGALVMVLLFSIVYVRNMSIKAGYDISSLMSQLEKSEIQYTSLLEQRSQAYDNASLYEKAGQMGMVIPDVKRTFYVKD